jgi:hypothetical protein
MMSAMASKRRLESWYYVDAEMAAHAAYAVEMSVPTMMI